MSVDPRCIFHERLYTGRKLARLWSFLVAYLDPEWLIYAFVEVV